MATRVCGTYLFLSVFVQEPLRLVLEACVLFHEHLELLVLASKLFFQRRDLCVQLHRGISTTYMVSMARLAQRQRAKLRHVCILVL